MIIKIKSLVMSLLNGITSLILRASQLRENKDVQQKTSRYWSIDSKVYSGLSGHIIPFSTFKIS